MVPKGWVFHAYEEATNASQPKIVFAVATWQFHDNVVLRGPIPPGEILIDLEETAPPYAAGFPTPDPGRWPPRPARFRLSAKPNSGLPFGPEDKGNIAYRLDFQAAGRFFSFRVCSKTPLSDRDRRRVGALLSTVQVAPRQSR